MFKPYTNNNNNNNNNKNTEWRFGLQLPLQLDDDVVALKFDLQKCFYNFTSYANKKNSKICMSYSHFQL